MIADDELDRMARKVCGSLAAMPTYYWRYVFSIQFDRPFTEDDARALIRRHSDLQGPPPAGGSWADIVKSL